jgi:hypothetical protein
MTVYKMKPEHIEEAKDMFAEILKAVESGDMSSTTITVFRGETGITIRVFEVDADA